MDFLGCFRVIVRIFRGVMGFMYVTGFTGARVGSFGISESVAGGGGGGGTAVAPRALGADAPNLYLGLIKRHFAHRAQIFPISRLFFSNGAAILL